MMKFRFFFLLIVFVFVSTGCSIKIDQDPIATPASQNTPVFQEVISTPQSIPVTWGDLHLNGKLVYIGSAQNPDSSFNASIHALDLKTGEITTIFHGPDNSWIYYLTVSPQGKQLVMSYSPPSGPLPSADPALYILPMDGSGPPQLLFTPQTTDLQYFQPEWSPDGKYIYFSYINRDMPTPEGQLYPDYQIYRIAYPDGQLEKIADEAFWPRVSADSTRLVYVSIDQTDATNKLIVANVDGTDPRQLEMSGKWIPSYIDAPIFSPDGQSILFSALSLSPVSSSTWLENLLGVTIASAHNLPSDWWSVSISGGTPVQLTHIRTTNLYASISPDKKYIASYSGNGLFLMNSDGTGANMLINGLGGIASTVTWMP